MSIDLQVQLCLATMGSNHTNSKPCRRLAHHTHRFGFDVIHVSSLLFSFFPLLIICIVVLHLRFSIGKAWLKKWGKRMACKNLAS